MSDLPESPQMGRLEYLKLYLYWNGAVRLFSCHNTEGRIYLAIWVEKTDDCNRWLYARTLPHKLDWLERRLVDIRSRFTEAAEESVYDVRIGRNNICCVEVLPCSKLTDDLLPTAGEFFKYN